PPIPNKAPGPAPGTKKIDISPFLHGSQPSRRGQTQTGGPHPRLCPPADRFSSRLLTMRMFTGFLPALLVLLLCLANGLAQPVPESRLARANRLILEGQGQDAAQQNTAWNEACAEFAQAYEEDGRRDPVLLLRIGRLRQRLKQNAEAIAAYQRFL